MKRILLITFALGLASATALAQGTINFGTTSAAHRVLQMDGITPVGPGYIAALYWGPLGSLEGALVQLGATTPVTAGTGFLVSGGTRTTGVATAPGTQATFQVRAWTASSGASWETALASGLGFFGKTALFDNPTGNPNNSPPDVPAFLSGWTQPVMLLWIPEPSSSALFALGLGACALIRRKKAIVAKAESPQSSL